MKSRHGRRTPEGAVVTVDGRPLGPRYDLHTHSLDGFEWGDGSSGSAQLAMAIATDYFGDEIGETVYHALKWALIAQIETDEWTLTAREIHDWYSEAFPSGSDN
jgi:hypothetical protein